MLVRTRAARGVQFRRARVVSEPIAPFIRFEYEITATVNIAAGEQVRWLPRRRASDLCLPGNDFWVFDDRLVRFGYFASCRVAVSPGNGHRPERDHALHARFRKARGASCPRPAGTRFDHVRDRRPRLIASQVPASPFTRLLRARLAASNHGYRGTSSGVPGDRLAQRTHPGPVRPGHPRLVPGLRGCPRRGRCRRDPGRLRGTQVPRLLPVTTLRDGRHLQQLGCQ